MPAVTASPVAASLSATAAGPTLPGKNGIPGTEGAPADFASLLQALQKLGGQLIPDGVAAGIAGNEITQTLNALKTKGLKDAEDDGAAGDVVDIASILGQIGIQPSVQPLVPPQTPAATNHPEDFRHGEDPDGDFRRAPGLDVAAVASRKTGHEDAPGLIKPEMEEIPGETKPAESSSHPLPPTGVPEKHAVAHGERAKLEVATPVQSPKWSSEVGQQVVWMAKNNIQEAQLSVNPPHLGPIEISLSLKDDSASAHFYSPHAEVREILEQALPRLREMLAGAGVQLGQSDVGAQSQQAFQQFAGRQNGNAANNPAFTDQHPSLQHAEADNPVATARVLKGNGLVDTFV